MTRSSLLLFALGSLVALAPPAKARPPEPKELVVFAAASLREVFENLATAFEKKHKGVKGRLSFAGSQELRTQIEHGARADIFASADEKYLAGLQNIGLASAPVVFTHNEPVLVVPTANPAGLHSFADLPKAENIVVGAPEVPIGAYTEALLAAVESSLGKTFREQVVAHIRSRELNVRQVLTKVALGEADAGIVYKSDARTAKDRVSMIAIPEDVKVVARYSIAVLATAPHPELAKTWIEAVLGKPGQEALAAAGFAPVSAPKAAKGGK
jgi:molybdate transport system substrate-binding protein